MANLNYNEGIHYLVTRPVEPIIDDGVGNYNISPIGFPVQNLSGELNENPTRITPEFVVGYNNVVDGSSRLIVDYTENVKSINNLVGLKTFTNSIDTITLSGSTATATTVHEHGYVTGKTVSISGTDQGEYSGDFTITVVDVNTFTYTISGTPATPATGMMITSSYTSSDKDLIVLNAQDNSGDNGYYVVTANQWRVLYVTSSDNMDVNVNANVNVDISVGSTPTYTFTVDTITTVSLGTGKLLAEVTTTDDNGFADGNLVTVAGSIYAEYNKIDEPIQRISGKVFRYEVTTDPGDELISSATVAYTVSDGDLVNVAAQTDETENALYIARSASAWEFYGFFYKWDGTENDNVVGDYGDELDGNGDPLNHYRKGYSLEETADFLKDKLEIQLEFGQFKGSNRPLRDNGAFVRWLMSGRKVNVGGAGSSKDVFIDGFGLGAPNAARRSMVKTGVVDPSDPSAVASKRYEIAMRNKRTVWGLTNHHSHALDGFFNKSPFVKDYPMIYNSAYDDLDPYGFLTGGHLPYDVDVERWRMTLTGTTASTDAEVRPIMIDTLWYHRDNSYHNNITIDATDPNMFGRHSMSIINNFDKEDKIVLTEQDISDASINTTTNVVTVPDGTAWAVGDYVQFVPATGATLPSGLSAYTTYTVATVSSNELTFTGVNITDIGSGSFTIERHVFDPYNNSEVVTSLNNITGITFPINGVNHVTVLSDTVGTVTSYYIKPRAKSSLTLLIPKGAGWSETSLTYDAAGANGINVYLESTETYFVTFTHPTLSTSDLMDELNQHNDMIPVPFDPLTTDIDSLTSIFVDNSLVDYTDAINKTNKIRSKKTFIHLPTPIGLPDGTPFELDVSLPLVPETNSFPFNTVGSLSGYKNYTTQPRVYVMSGHQKFSCDNYIVNSLTHVGGDATIELASDHGIYTSTFTDGEVEVATDYIAVSNWKDISVGDIVRFKSDGVLPTATPPITPATDYVVTAVEFGKIKIATTTGTDIDITAAVGGGTHSIVIQSAIKFDMRGSTDTYYNNQFVGYIYDFNSIKFTVDVSAVNPAPGPVIVDRVITVTGSNGTKGLTERYNSSIFSPMPEVEFAEDGNLYHQGFDTDNLTGNGLLGDDRDIRTLVATVYPTTTSTFAWRIDNSPRIRMLQWSLMNVSALGGTAETGSFSNVAYKRNKAIYNEFPLVFKNGSNGNFSVYDNPLSYIDITDPTFTQQQINAFVRIRYPDTLTPQNMNDILSEEDAETVGSFLYQAGEAYSDLIRDFQAGRVLVDSNNENLDEYKASLPVNHSGVDAIPTSFFDHGATTKFIDFTSVDSMSSDAEYEAYQRWYTKNIYVPEYIVSAQGSTELLTFDAYRNVDSTLKDYINSFYTDTSERVSSANNRYITDVLNPIIDPEFEFSVGSQHKFIDYVIANSSDTATEVTILDDIRRRFWDSSYVIPDVSERQIQNAYHITYSGTSDITSIEDAAKFHGAAWIPFSKVFSTDGVAPSENSIVDIVDYATIIAGSYPELDATLDNAIASNLIATRFKELGYIEAFVSVNTTDSTESDKEEFLRNYVTGYANRLPFRFYNGFKIAVSGREESTMYATNIANELVDTESDVERIYTYSTNHYLNSYMTFPNSDLNIDDIYDVTEVAKYLNDNFVFSALGGNTADLSLYELIESGYVPDDPTATLYLWDWPNLDGWTRQTNNYQSSGAGYAKVENGTLITDTSYPLINPIYRYDQTIGSSFVTESYINPSDDQFLSFNTSAGTASDVDFHTVMSSAYASFQFEDSPNPSVFPDPDPNGVYFHTRKDENPIDMSTANTTGNDYTHFNSVRLFTYIPNRLYRVLFARLSTNEFMVKVYDTTDNSLVGAHSSSVLFPNLVGATSDGMDLILSTGRQHGHPELGYFDKQSYANELTDDEILGLFGIVDDKVYAHDLNPSWWYFEAGNPSTDPDNSKINDMITVSGMNHIADREFYTSKMKYNYTRIKMSFVFSEKLGRWMSLDYRQAPTSYLTPTFGATALRQIESSTVNAGTSAMDVTNYVNALQPDVSNSFGLRSLGDGRLIKVNGAVEFSVGDTVSMYIDGSNQSVVNTITKIEDNDPIYIYSFANDFPEQFESFDVIQVSHPINTIVSGQYPINLLSGVQSTDILWKNPSCLDPVNIYKELTTTPYWNMDPMILNPNCYPFLSEEFPYDNDGTLKSVLDHTYDSSGAENYRFTRLIEPNLPAPDGINFVVPNNVHGGRIDADNSLFLYQPHMWKVFWHMRPAVCAMEETDIPSPTSRRIGGEMADPFLNNMFCYPNARDPQYYIPWHNDMNLDWLNSGWLLIDAKIDEPDINPERDLYSEIDATIVGGDDERNDFWEIESSDVTANERDSAITDLE